MTTTPVPPEIAEIERTHIGLYQDFPQPGVLFRDMTPQR